MVNKLAGRRYICDYEGQNPAYAKLDDLPRPVNVRSYGRAVIRENQSAKLLVRFNLSMNMHREL